MINDCHINLLPQGRQINTKSGKSMMETLMGQNIFLRSDCGGRGTCGKCRVKIVSTSYEQAYPPQASWHDTLNKITSSHHLTEFKEACKLIVTEDISVEIPESSLLSSHIIRKAPVSLPEIFKERFKALDEGEAYGIATDLGTTTLAIYLCNTARGEVVSSLSVKNPQALYGDDVMTRIGAIFQKEKTLAHQQRLVVRAMEWGIKKLLASHDLEEDMISQMVVVGNPTMIHILAGIDPTSIGISPHQPAFYEARNFCSTELNFTLKKFSIQTLPQVSGFIGGDILSAALAVDLDNQPEGTLLVDLGTNGELMLKAKDGFLATSCATGPAFEGASLSCGMQAIPGAINKIHLKSKESSPQYTVINPSNTSGLKPSGICGTGVISAVAQFLQKKVLMHTGAFKEEHPLPYVLVPDFFSADNSAIFISQKDIRSVQLGKAALISGIEFLLKEAGLDRAEKIIIAGAFGTSLDKADMMTLGMIPAMDPDRVTVTGNSAGAGAIMALCDPSYIDKARHMAERVTVVDLTCHSEFQDVFIENLHFPDLDLQEEKDYILDYAE